MAEIIDYLCVFWGFLGVGVFLVGKVYEQQQQVELSKRKKKHEYDNHATSSYGGYNNWRSPTSANSTTSPYSNYNQYSSSLNDTPYSQTQQLQQQQQHQNFYGNNYQSASTSSGYNKQSQNNFYSSSSSSSEPKYNNNHLSYNNYNNHEAPTNLSYRQQDYNNAQQNHLNSYTTSADNNTATSHQQQHHHPDSDAIPTATGFNPDSVDWVNQILYLFFTQTQKYGPIIAESIYRSLNEKLSNITHSSSDYAHLIIEFTNLNLYDSTKPELTNIRTEIESEKSISACCKIYNKRVSFDLSIQQLYNITGQSDTTTTTTTTSATDMQADFFGLNNRSMQYELVLENLEGKLKSIAMLNDKLIVIQFMEKPDTKILLKPILQDSYASSSSAYRQPMRPNQLINEDALVQIILQALTQVVVDLYFGDDVDFPQFCGHLSKTGTIKNKISNILRIGSGASDLRRIKQELFGGQSNLSGDGINRRVFVKILQAKNINYNQNVTCLLELDQPQQMALSTTKVGSSNPIWNEHFLFSLSDKTRELNIELWDSINTTAVQAKKANNHNKQQQQQQQQKNNSNNNKADLTSGAKFLGLAKITSVVLDELRKNPAQRQQVSLQPQVGSPQGDLANSVGGELAVELLYLENPVPSPSPSPTPSSGGGLKKSNSATSLGLISSAAASYAPGDVVSIDRKLTPSGYVITTTTITKQQQQQSPPTKRTQTPVVDIHQQQQQQQQTNFDEFPMVTTTTTTTSTNQYSRAETPTTGGGGGDARSESALDSSVASPSSTTGGRLSRSRSRSLLRAIKKRFSFSRTRSRSLGPGDRPGGLDDDDDRRDLGGRQGSASPASISTRLDNDQLTNAADYYAGTTGGSRSRASSEISAGYPAPDSRAKSVPTSRDLSEVPTIVINKGRLSDTASAFTFTHPKSQLVIEVLEPTLERGSGGLGKQKSKPRYYAISDDDSNANKRKWSRRGTKLHLFNQHQFVACHLAGSSTCHLCGRVFSRRPGKQGYKCRNCHLLSHKQCHVKVDHNCPYAASNIIQLEYIDADPPANLVDEVIGLARSSSSSAAGSTSSLKRGQRLRQGMAKSISVEVDDR